MMWSKRVVCSSSCTSTSEEQAGAGLRNILSTPAPNSNFVLLKPIFLLSCKFPDSLDCYLKYCHLCIKPLNLDKEIYMYKGDLGFCSVECRERQIYMDEIREMEANSKRIFSNFRLQRGGRCETSKLLKEFRQRRRPFSSPSTNTSNRERVVFSYS